jgi:hypothetical protein
MDVKPSEIEEVKVIGNIEGKPVKLIKTAGGFWMAIGAPRGKAKEEALAAGSHPAIVKYNVQKQHSDYQPVLEKSETEPETDVTGLSELLPKTSRDQGFDLYSLKKGNEINYVVTKFGSEAIAFRATIVDDAVVMAKANKPSQEPIQGLGAAITQALVRDAIDLKKSEIVHGSIKLKVKAK